MTVCGTGTERCIGKYHQVLRNFDIPDRTAILLFCHGWQKGEAPFLFNSQLENDQNVSFYLMENPKTSYSLKDPYNIIQFPQL